MVRKRESESVLNKMLGLKANPRPEKQLSVMREEPAGFGMLPQELFTKLLCLERKRTERSGKRFVLMLLDPGNLLTRHGPSARPATEIAPGIAAGSPLRRRAAGDR